MSDTAFVYLPLADLASRFPILPTRLADALDAHGPNVLAWARIRNGRLLSLDIEVTE